MADVAECGIDLSLSHVTPERVVEQLDIARDASVRLIIGTPLLRVAPGSVTDEWKRNARELVETVRDHDGLFGYYVADAPQPGPLQCP